MGARGSAPENPFDLIIECMLEADSIDVPEVYERVLKRLVQLFKLEVPAPQLSGGRGGATLAAKLSDAAQNYQYWVSEALDAAARRSPVRLKRALRRAAGYLRVIHSMAASPAAAARAEVPVEGLEVTDVVAECGPAAAALFSYVLSRGEVDKYRLYEYCVEAGIDPARAARALECLVGRGRLRVVVRGGVEHYTPGW